jgi:ribonuclease J
MGAGGQLRVIPLGGLGEIGKNMMLVESDDTIIIVDAGMMFPEEQMPGVDLVIPDFSYLVDKKRKVKALILTHGHEDHIGALPYLLQVINVPVYGTKLTLGFAKNRLEGHSLPFRPEFVEVTPRQQISFGGLGAEFFRVCHSVPDGIGIAFHTPYGIIVHSGDFKIDFTPAYSDFMDFYKLAELGEKGVLLLMADSTNAENEGYTPSEGKLSTTLKETIAGSPGKVLVTTFASSIHRIQQIFDICVQVEKKVALLGKSMEKNVAMAKSLGYLRFPESVLISPEKVISYGRGRVVVLTTGSQGEPMSALSRVASGKYKAFDVEKGDTVIISASIIPGNERIVTRIINSLFRKGASVIYEGFEDLHVSGHASREELKLLMAITKPRYVLPIHGEFRHLVHHSNLAKQMGIKEERVIIAEDGDVIGIDANGISIVDRVPAGHVFIDGKGVGDVETTVLRDREKLSADGILVAVVPIGMDSKEFLPPEIFTRGFLNPKIADDLINSAKDLVFQFVRQYPRDRGIGWDGLRNGLRRELKSFFFKETARSPMIVPIIIEV